MKNIDNFFMQRAIKLAKDALYIFYDTLILGYVIVKNNLIILENYKKINEFNYINNYIFLQQSTIYITLEPNLYYKKVSFIDFILKNKISKVVIGMRNPCNPNTGLIIKLLKSSKIKVFENILKNECYEINKRFFTFYKKKRPFIMLKWTQSLNGIICNNIRKKNIIHEKIYEQLTHKWYTEEESILIHSNNIMSINSIIKDKYWYGKNPIIIILDKNLIIPSDHFIYKSNNKILIFTEKNKKYIKNNIIFFKLKFNKELLKKIINKLYIFNIKSVIIEISNKNIEFLIKKQNWDEAKIAIYDVFLNKGIKVPNIKGNILSKSLFFNERLITISSNFQ